MDTHDDSGKDEIQVWEIVMILLIWLLAASLVYIVFCNAVTEQRNRFKIQKK